MTRKILVAALLGLIAVPSAAQTSDIITFVPAVKLGEPAPTCYANTDSLLTVTLHLVILHPTGRAVLSWNAGAVLVDGGTLLSTQLVDGMDLLPDDELNVSITNAQGALTPNDSDVIHLASVEVLLPDPDAEVMVRLTPSTQGGYTYDGFARLYQAWPLAPHSQEDGLVAFRIAPDCEQFVANEALDWSTLKRRYR
ncbi:hypothetical protein KDK88_09195 [bacterium]|nr:hypothetical protein [bacterium]HPF35735.1 hypothetical protein [Candidatus Krumholzibacteria bacterium]HRX52219.1 hypothetical protein [Candidatus Krumholzibacteria bacterium]